MNALTGQYELTIGSSGPWVPELPMLLRGGWERLSSIVRGISGGRALLPVTHATGKSAGSTPNPQAILTMMADPRTTAEAVAASADPADWDDVQAVLGGDGDSYAHLVRRHQPAITAYMWRFTRDRNAWEELVHDVFVEAYFSLANYAGRAPLGHWLKRIATRVGYRYWQRRERRRREVPLAASAEAAVAAPDPADAAWHAAELVHELLARLAPRDRLVLTLSYLESCSVAEVARLTGWSESLVKVQTHRARKRLAKLCAQMGIEL